MDTQVNMPASIRKIPDPSLIWRLRSALITIGSIPFVLAAFEVSAFGGWATGSGEGGLFFVFFSVFAIRGIRV
jgi:hypothetical protein